MLARPLGGSFARAAGQRGQAGPRKNKKGRGRSRALEIYPISNAQLGVATAPEAEANEAEGGHRSVGLRLRNRGERARQHRARRVIEDDGL